MKNRSWIISTLLIILCLVLTLALYKSDKFDILNIEIFVDAGECPETIVEEIDELKGLNMLFFNEKKINNILLNNSLIGSIQIKRDFPKNLRIYLIKSQVNAIIIYYEGNAKAYSIIGEKLLPVNEKDIDSLDDSVIKILSDKDSFIHLKESGEMDLFLASIDVIKANSYLISSINYSNNGMIGNQYFDIYLNSLNVVLRFRESFDKESFKSALEIAREVYDYNYDSKIILDIYHGAIVERH
jgi:hypothetical protein